MTAISSKVARIAKHPAVRFVAGCALRCAVATIQHSGHRLSAASCCGEPPP